MINNSIPVINSLSPKSLIKNDGISLLIIIGIPLRLSIRKPSDDKNVTNVCVIRPLISNIKTPKKIIDAHTNGMLTKKLIWVRFIKFIRFLQL